MKVLKSIMIALLAFCLTLSVAACGKDDSDKKPQVNGKPVIELSVEEKEKTVPFTETYYIPIATCKSTADNANLEVAHTVTGPEDQVIEVVNGKFSPVSLGIYTIKYNATDIDGTTKADEVVFKVTFTAVDKPVITVNSESEELTSTLIKEYKLPTATAYSKFKENKELDVTISAKDSKGNQATVKNGCLLPSEEGVYTVTYSAKEFEPLNTPADNVEIKVTFVASDPVFSAVEGAVAKIFDGDKFVIPAFDEVATISHDFYTWTSADFTITKAVTFTADGSNESQDVIDPDVAKFYQKGKISIVYTLKLNSDNSKTFTYKHEINVERIYDTIDGLIDGLDGVNKEIVNDDSISPNAMLKFKATVGWGGFMFTGRQNDLLGTLNKSQTNALILHCYNSSDIQLKLNIKVYEFVEATPDVPAEKVVNKYIAAPNDKFDIVIQKDCVKGLIERFSISIRGENEAFTIMDAEIVDAKDYETSLWKDNKVPTDLKAYTSDKRDVVTDQVEISQYSKDGLEGVLIDNKKEEDFYFDFLSSSNAAANSIVRNKFVNVRPSTRYNQYFSYKITNIGDAPVAMWAQVGHGGNNYNGSFYYYSIPAHGSQVIYYNANKTDDNYSDPATLMDYVAICMNAVSKVVISDVKVINYPTFNDVTIEKFEVYGKDNMHTPENLNKFVGDSWSVPSFESMYESNFPATATSKVFYKKTSDAQGVEKTEFPIILEAGFYDVVYDILETATKERYSVKFTLKVDITNVEKFIDVVKPDVGATITKNSQGSAEVVADEGRWVGVAVWGYANSITEQLNADEDKVMIMHCSNPTQDILKLNITTYSETDSRLQSFVARAGEKFEIVIRNNFVAGVVNKITYSMAHDGGSFPGGQFNIDKIDFVNGSDYRVNLWDDAAVPTDFVTKVDTNQGAINDVELSQYNSNGLKGLRIKNNSGSYRDVDFLTGSNKSVLEKFANASKNAKYNIFFEYTFTNIGSNAAEYWNYAGHNIHNMPIYKSYYTKTLQNGESARVYCAPSFMNDSYNVNDGINWVLLGVNGNVDVVVSDFCVYDFSKLA